MNRGCDQWCTNPGAGKAGGWAQESVSGRTAERLAMVFPDQVPSGGIMDYPPDGPWSKEGILTVGLSQAPAEARRTRYERKRPSINKNYYVGFA